MDGCQRYKEVLVMLALCFSEGDCAFVYSAGRPIGALLVGEVRGGGRVKLCLSGDRRTFEVLRPRVVERRFGADELAKLTEQFLTATNHGSHG